MRRGEVRLVSLDPVVGSEAAHRRPAVVVSNEAANAVAQRTGRGVVTVVPLTSNIERVHDFQVLLPAETTGLHRDSKAQAEQVRALSPARFGPVLGILAPTELRALDAALRLHLDL